METEEIASIDEEVRAEGTFLEPLRAEMRRGDRAVRLPLRVERRAQKIQLRGRHRTGQCLRRNGRDRRLRWGSAAELG